MGEQCEPSDDEVNWGMQYWELDAGMELLAKAWFKCATENTYTARAVLFTGKYMDMDGVFFAASCGASTTLSKQNADVFMQMRNGGIPMPEYLLYDVFFYENLTIDNVYGCFIPKHSPIRTGTLQEYLAFRCAAEGIQNWIQYAPAGKLSESRKYEMFRKLDRIN